MERKSLFIAFSTQKGGVGKTAFTVLLSSYMHYLDGKSIAVVDCDFPQHSIMEMRKRDSELVISDPFYKRMAFNQFKEISKKQHFCSLAKFPKYSNEILQKNRRFCLTFQISLCRLMLPNRPYLG